MRPTIQIFEKHNYAYVDVGGDWAAWNLIDSTLTLIEPDEPAYKFLDPNTGGFLRGFASRVVSVLQRANYQVNWTQQPISLKNERRGPVAGALQHLQPWVVEQMSQFSNGIIDIATRFGKSYTYAGWYAYMGRPMTLILVPRSAIAAQMHKELQEFLGEEIGLIMGSVNKVRTWQNLTIASVASLCNKEGQIHPEHIPFLQAIEARINDEIHLQHKFNATVFNAMPYVSYCWGGSATPNVERELANWNNEGWFGPSRIRISSRCLANRGILANVDATMHRYMHYRLPDLEWLDLYNTGIVYNNERNQHLAYIARQHMQQGRKGLIFINYVAHAEELKKEIPGSIIVASKLLSLKQSEEIKELFNAGQVSCVIVTKKWREGVTLRADFAINAEGGKADHVLVQKLGRGLLPKADGSPLYWHDLLDGGQKVLYKHGIARLATLRREEWDVNIVEENVVGDQVRNTLLTLEREHGQH